MSFATRTYIVLNDKLNMMPNCDMRQVKRQTTIGPR